MPLKATIANTLWGASNLPAYWSFRRALRDPGAKQRSKLRQLITQNSSTAFGKAHGFDKITCYDEFARRVPLTDYSGLAPWIERTRQGESRVLTSEPVTHLISTSGSAGAKKLIPFTVGLQREFNAAIGPWLVDLSRQCPGMTGGPAYWSVTPVMGEPTSEKSGVPISFDTDAAYIGGIRRRLAEAVMAVPAGVGSARPLETFRYETLLHLLCCRELRLISVWHPSFLTLLLDALPGLWEVLIENIASGSSSMKPQHQRAAELRRSDPEKTETLWPNLRVVSCWGDAAASIALENLRRRFPGVLVQPKGLIATEAIVTLPFGEHYPLAVGSHFFEFIDSDGRVFPVEAVREKEEYEIVVTTAGGLWRYRLGDRVRVTGFAEKTPSFKFLGRSEDVSDRFGEKLSEQFVNEALREVFGCEAPQFALVAPDEQDGHCGYTLYVEGVAHPNWAQSLDQVLRRNPHYAYCRDLGQLAPPRLFKVSSNAYETFARGQAANGTRLGDIKPKTLSRSSDWSTIFLGDYVDCSNCRGIKLEMC
jgi:GH3 auxin-responsive promoter